MQTIDEELGDWKIMRIIVAGDKSRYQFFRDIINVDVSQMREEFYTENLGGRTVYLTSDKNQVNNDVVLFSDKVPLNTVLCFPEEFLDVPTICEMEDRVVLFDEFPYATEKKLERAQKISDFGVADQLQVILIINNRIGLQSDLSTVEMALEEAERLYQKSNISVYRYHIGDRPEFLFWSVGLCCTNGRRILEKSILEAQKDVEQFESFYDLMYTTDLSVWIEDPAFLNNIFKYDSIMREKDIFEVYYSRIYDLFQKKSEFEDFYVSLYTDSVINFCVWDLSCDIEDLKISVNDFLKEQLRRKENLMFNGDEREYESFLNENRAEIIDFRKAIVRFFSDDLKFFLKKRLQKNIDCMMEMIR